MTDEESNESDIVTVMHQTTQVDYLMDANPTMQRYGEMMSQRKITGHKCPECSFVYVPPKNYCPMCVIPTGLEHEVVVEAKGTVTSFTVIDPSQYPGAEETEAYVVASILLDGASMTIGQQRVAEILPEDVRTGLRVEAEWSSGDSTKGTVMGSAIAHWGPNGEPDVPYEDLKEHIL